MKKERPDWAPYLHCFCRPVRTPKRSIKYARKSIVFGFLEQDTMIVYSMWGRDDLWEAYMMKNMEW